MELSSRSTQYSDVIVHRIEYKFNTFIFQNETSIFPQKIPINNKSSMSLRNHCKKRTTDNVLELELRNCYGDLNVEFMIKCAAFN